jgi:hypothetical protein
MYSNYQPYNIPNNQFPSSISMNHSTPSNFSTMSNSQNRFAGGFLGPFILGGITGGLVAPAFYQRPYYNNYYYPYPYGQYY